MRKPQVILSNLNNFLGCSEEKQFERCSCCSYILCVGEQSGGTGIWGLWLLLCLILLVTVDVEPGEGDRRETGMSQLLSHVGGVCEYPSSCGVQPLVHGGAVQAGGTGRCE